MTIRSSAILIPIVVGATAGYFVPLSFWKDIMSPALTALSIVAGAGLVRLARGIPFTNPDHFTVQEVRSVASALKLVARRIKLLVIVSLIAIMLVALSGPLSDFIEKIRVNHTLQLGLESFISGITGVVNGYVGVRLLHVLRGDLSLMELQAEVLEKAAARKAAKDEMQRLEPEEGKAFRDPEGYGNLIVKH